MEANALPINMDNLRATGRLAEKQVNVALEQAELNGEVIPQEVMNFLNVFKDDATREALFKTTDNASVQKIMNDNGVPMTEEDVDSFLAAVGNVGKKLAQSDGKLTEEELEQISGGGWLKDAWNWCTSTTVGKIVTGVVVGAAIGAAFWAASLCALGAAYAAVVYGGEVLATAGAYAAVGAVGGAMLGGIIGALGGVRSAQT